MSTGAAAPRDPRMSAVPERVPSAVPGRVASAVPMGVLLAAGAAATAVSTPPARERARQEAGGAQEPAGRAGPAGPADAGRAAADRGTGCNEQAAPEPEAA
ncbi:hypothetical protein ACFVGY_09260 [Streptomyces sp. NPDC127106]|uniref:hypothetical protein n=1 Tax=Streptomyces sp. NPDC127106 TaxID=3345360 RepID=UPI00363A5688